MDTKKELGGHAAAFGSYLIFGLNIIACKNVANSGLVSPFCLFSIRAIGATLLFWFASMFLPKESVEKKDLIRIFFASMLGLFLTQIVFLKAITITTPMDASIISTLTPIMTMFIAAFYLKEPITVKKVVGVLISFCGVTYLIFNSTHESGGIEKSAPLGIFFMVLNGLFFALYLGIFRPLTMKYSVVTFMKWMFLFSLLAGLPFSVGDFMAMDYASFSTGVVLNLAYVVFFATFISYLLIPIGQKLLRPTLVSMYSYVQPIVAAGLSIYLGMDELSWEKLLAAVLVFVGVAVVNRSKAAKEIKE
ncbi:MAG: DMT family transporter [Paludibacteraceae bacterium]|nr:DMT family transporter [Paludibacteraceae bacterium]